MKIEKKPSVLKLYIQDFTVGYGDTCNNNINIFYTCIRIAKKEIDIE